METLSRVTDGKKINQSGDTERENASENAESIIINQPQETPNFTEALLIRHEREVFRIKNAKK